jgi:hypothetical protein
MRLLFIFLLALIISGLLIFTIPKLKGKFKSVEIFLLFLFTSNFCQSFFYILTSPYKRIIVVTEHLPFWTVRLEYGVILPITLMWVMYVYRSRSTIFWIIFGILIEKLFLILGVLDSQSDSWYPSLEMFFAMVVVLLTVWFVQFSRDILRKEKVI